jgi:hypothetical protein
MSLRPAWTTQWVPNQPNLHRKTLSQKKIESTQRRSQKEILEVKSIVTEIKKNSLEAAEQQL